MQVVDQKLSAQEISALSVKYGDYVKVTVDIDKKILVIGCELHADGEKILLDLGSHQDNIWGGGINFKTRGVDATAVLNLRPKLNNLSLEILDPDRRQKFMDTVKSLFNL